MGPAWGIVLVIAGLFAWVGQTISWLSPDTAVRLTLAEPEEDVEPAYWADARGEAAWDFFSLWTLAVAGALLIFGVEAWAYFGLVGGGTYGYFAGRGILTRIAIQRRGLSVGKPADVRLGLAALGLWGVIALVTIAAAVVALPVS